MREKEALLEGAGGGGGAGGAAAGAAADTALASQWRKRWVRSESCLVDQASHRRSSWMYIHICNTNKNKNPM